MLYIVDDVLQDISALIGAHPPERGGALLGLPGRLFVTRFLFDVHAETTGATYRPSGDLNALVQNAEQAEGLEFKGILHSHPSSLDRPSSQDAQEFEVGLALNPHMSFYLAPIVTQHYMLPLQPHELPLAGAKVSFYAAYRRPEARLPASYDIFRSLRRARAGVRVQPMVVQEIPIARDVQRVCDHFGGESIDVGITDVDGHDMLTRRVALTGGLELLFFFSEAYPHLPPLVLVTAAGTSTEQLELPWSLRASGQDPLTEALSRVLTPGGRYRKVYGPVHGKALTTDATTARLAGWSARFSGEDVAQNAQDLQAGLFARSQGLLSEAISAKCVLVAGTGSVGSYCTEQLGRSGVGAFTLLDPDKVELANLSRTV